MGCGASKATDVANASSAGKPEVAPSQAPEQQQKTPAPAATAATGGDGAAPSQQPSGSGNVSSNKNAGTAATEEDSWPGEDENQDPSSKKNSTSNSDDNAATSNPDAGSTLDHDLSEGGFDSRFGSAISTRSAPSIMERPSSRGGQAFEIQWEDESPRHTRPPRRLQKLNSSRKREYTLEELKRKQIQASKRKAEYDRRIKEKIANDLAEKEAKKNRDVQERADETQKALSAKVDAAEEKRQAHFRSLRDKLREKEEHSRKVRENKKRIEAENS